MLTQKCSWRIEAEEEEEEGSCTEKNRDGASMLFPYETPLARLAED